MITTEELYQFYLKNPSVSTDTRNIGHGTIFFALKGDNFDANKFAQQAIDNGAAFAVVDNAQYATGKQFLLVNDSLTALQDLARHHRKQLSIPVVGLTGSNGKTTSKELINAVLAEKFKTFATHGNLNNHIGVPLSILAIKADVQIAVIEMGANHQKEIELLCSIAQPTHGIITNVGMAHLDGFGGFEGVKKGKAELYTFLKDTDGYTFVNRDSDHLMEMTAAAKLNKVIYYGSDRGNAVQGSLQKSDPYIEINWTNHAQSSTAETNLTGSYNFENVLAAICIGDFFDMSPEAINTGLQNYHPNNNRSQLNQTANNTVICDFYNANPSSMAAALNNIETLSAEYKTAILGDMFELGSESAEQHERIAKQAEKSGLSEIIFIGKYFYALKDQIEALFFETPAQAAAHLQQNPIKNHLVLLKGSRGMKLENLLQYL